MILKIEQLYYECGCDNGLRIFGDKRTRVRIRVESVIVQWPAYHVKKIDFATQVCDRTIARHNEKSVYNKKARDSKLKYSKVFVSHFGFLSIAEGSSFRTSTDWYDPLPSGRKKNAKTPSTINYMSCIIFIVIVREARVC